MATSSKNMNDFDVLVVGGGHAGTEAANAAVSMGCRVGLVSLDLSRVGVLSCNPAMGGLGKGQLVKEIDAMGGLMGKITDRTSIQYRILNRSKGPAVHSTRSQVDKVLYAQEMQKTLRTFPNLKQIQGEVAELIWTEKTSGKRRISGIILGDGSTITSSTVVITSGTFLRAIMHTGKEQAKGGRLGDGAAYSLSNSLEKLGFELKRLKTGTPPRLLDSSINWDVLEEQKGDEDARPFSVWEKPDPWPHLKQVSCFITYTNEETHQIIENHFGDSPMFSGVIQGIGPRYCPSVEDKVKRFRDRARHQIFLEPEGLSVNEIYVNGVSTSLPKEVQEKFLRTVKGLENAVFLKHGYAVEYDCVQPTQLSPALEAKEISGLFFAGQINGTSGYEEAGAQGLVAGINAGRHSLQREPYYFDRFNSYIGVMIDDLITQGVDEPYRMFTSRAENRLFLREGNADFRLSEDAYQLDLLTNDQWSKFQTRRDFIIKAEEFLKTVFVIPVGEDRDWLQSLGTQPGNDRLSLAELVKRPEIRLKNIFAKTGNYFLNAREEDLEEIETRIKYKGYIERDADLFQSVRKNESLKIPETLSYEIVPGLSREVSSRLSKVKPFTLGQASRVSGVTPASMASLYVYLRSMSSKDSA